MSLHRVLFLPLLLFPPGAFEGVRMLAAAEDGRVRLERHGWCRLQGIEAPPMGSEGRRALGRALASFVGKGPWRVRIEEGGEGPFATLWPEGSGQSLNEELLARGLAWFRTRTKEVRAQEALLEASAKARRKGLGLWRGCKAPEGPPPVQRGAVLGLYYREERFDYHRQIDRVRAIGAEWVTFLLTGFVDRVDSVEVEFDPRRTVKTSRFRETLAYARRKGLRMALMPIVLIRHPGEDDWRGTLRPRDPGSFWLSYDRFLCRWLDLAREGGVELFYVGSEYCSLERSREAWIRVIQNARGRFPGWLGYSVNWDHYDVPEFWSELDQVGMTAYFELTEDEDAKLSDLEGAWRRIRGDLERASKRLKRPIVITELGYASQDGANTAPWNYFLARDKPDPAEQADCFRAFSKVMIDAPFLQGVHFFDFFEEGGPGDTTFALHGKPAWKVVEDFLARFRR